MQNAIVDKRPGEISGVGRKKKLFSAHMRPVSAALVRQPMVELSTLGCKCILVLFGWSTPHHSGEVCLLPGAQKQTTHQKLRHFSHKKSLQQISFSGPQTHWLFGLQPAYQDSHRQSALLTIRSPSSILGSMKNCKPPIAWLQLLEDTVLECHYVRLQANS